jgi:hypothetical protein
MACHLGQRGLGSDVSRLRSGPSLGAVRRGSSDSCRDPLPGGSWPVPTSSGVAPSDTGCCVESSNLRRLESVIAGAPADTTLDPGSRSLARPGRPERAGRRVGWAAVSRDWRLRSYSGVAPEDREGAGRRSSDRRPEPAPGKPQGRVPSHRGNGAEGEPNQYGSTGFGGLRSPGEPHERSRSVRRRPDRARSVCEAFGEEP